MPIYAYKCSHCGHADDVMQKMSDAELTMCPQCGQSAYSKQITAAGFQLKGSGYYATDFKTQPAGAPASTEAPAPSAAPSPAAAPAPACGAGACPACLP